MANKDKITLDFKSNPNNWNLDLCGPDGCFDPLECASWGDITGSEESVRVQVGCIGSDGKYRLKGSYQDLTNPERATFALTVQMDDYAPVAEARKLARDAGCTVEARLSVRCGEGSNREVKGWFPLPDLDLAVPLTLPAVTKDGTGNATPFQIVVNPTWSRQTEFVDLSSIECVAFENDTDEATVAVLNCAGAICSTGKDACGIAQTQRGVCDNWTLVTTGTDTFTVYTSNDGGRTYPDSEVVAGLGDAIFADCDNVYTTNGRVVICNGVYSLESVPVPAGGFTVAADNLLGFGNNGAYTYDTISQSWGASPSQADTGTVALNVAASDGNVMFMGGPSDGIAIGVVYQYSLDEGDTWTQGVLAIAGWSTIADVTHAADVTNGVITITVSNGSQTKVLWSIDGENWNDSYTINSVPASTSQILRPDSSLTYVIQDGQVYLNPSGLCECEWRLEKTVTQTDAVWGVCESDPTYLHYVYTTP